MKVRKSLIAIGLVSKMNQKKTPQKKEAPRVLMEYQKNQKIKKIKN